MLYNENWIIKKHLTGYCNFVQCYLSKWTKIFVCKLDCLMVSYLQILQSLRFLVRFFTTSTRPINYPQKNLHSMVNKTSSKLVALVQLWHTQVGNAN